MRKKYERQRDRIDKRGQEIRENCEDKGKWEERETTVRQKSERKAIED